MATPSNFSERVAARRARAKKPGALRRRVAPQRYPKHLERSYAAQLLQAVAVMRNAARRHILPRIREVRADSVATNTIRLDAIPFSIEEGIRRARAESEAAVSESKASSVAKKVADRISAEAKAATAKQLRAAMGVDVLQSEPQLSGLIGDFVQENVSLIQSLPTKTFDQIESLVQDTVQRGGRVEDLADDIEGRFDVTESRATLIARDQVGKAFSAITEARHKALGITQFRWSSSNDERVRAEHEALDGEVFDYDNPPVLDGEPSLPGEPIQCRCVAVPVVEDLVDDVEAEEGD